MVWHYINWVIDIFLLIFYYYQIKKFLKFRKRNKEIKRFFLICDMIHDTVQNNKISLSNNNIFEKWAKYIKIYESIDIKKSDFKEKNQELYLLFRDDIPELKEMDRKQKLKNILRKKWYYF